MLKMTFDLQTSSMTVELLLLMFFPLVGFEVTFGDKNEPKVIKVIVEEGSDAILPCSLSTKEDIEFKLFDWKKDGPKNVFLYDAGIHYNNSLVGQDEQFKGRVSHFPEELKSGNASIIIRDTKEADSGDYTCVFPRLQPRQISHIKLVVGRILKDRTAENIPGGRIYFILLLLLLLFSVLAVAVKTANIFYKKYMKGSRRLKQTKHIEMMSHSHSDIITS